MDKNEHQYYDQGWNARVRGERFRSVSEASVDWRCGWRDCDGAEESYRVLQGEPE